MADNIPMALINPALELSGEKIEGTEGCLSFPGGQRGDPPSISGQSHGAQLIDGRKVTFEAEGLLAIALQYEVDHLNGILFIERMNSAAKVGIARKLKRLQREASGRG